MWLFVLWMACDKGDERLEGQEVGDCENGADDDADGSFDCDDDGCAAAPACEESDADTDSDTDADTDADSDTDTDSDTDADTDSDTDADTDADAPAARWSGATRLPDGYSLRGGGADDFAGHTVDMGDLDGDGEADVAVAAVSSEEGETFGGMVYLVHGPVTGDLPLADAPTVLGEAESLRLGASLRFVHDMDANGGDELLVGSYASESAGAAWLIRSAFSGTHGVSVIADVWTGEVIGDRAGCDVDDAGDIDGDGIHDMLIGATYSSFYSSEGGAAYVVSGPALGGGSLGDADVRVYGDAGDRMGGAVAGLGDVNGDGADDFAVTVNGSATKGLRVFFGPVSGVRTTGDADANLWPQVAGWGLGDSASSVAGRADLDGDGRPDVALGLPAWSTGWDTTAYTGQVVIVSGADVAGDVDLRFAHASITGAAAGDALGRRVRTADLDGDGFGDLLLGANGTDTHGTDSGTAYLFYGDVSGAVSASDADATINGARGDYYAGAGLAGGRDVTGDGVIDLAIGSSRGAGDATDSGLVAILPGAL